VKDDNEQQNGETQQHDEQQTVNNETSYSLAIFSEKLDVESDRETDNEDE
jgi:hypothetical protein